MFEDIAAAEGCGVACVSEDVLEVWAVEFFSETVGFPIQNDYMICFAVEKDDAGGENAAYDEGYIEIPAPASALGDEAAADGT